MFSWLNNKKPIRGGVMFRGAMQPRYDEFTYLDGLGYQRRLIHQKPGIGWKMNLCHPQYGEAIVCTNDQFHPPSDLILKLDPRLTEEDADSIRSCGSSLIMEMASKPGSVLRDRKLGLRIIRDVMGEDGVAGLDADAQSFWTRAALDDELAHEADLDIESLYTIHDVLNGESPESGSCWVHTHGLAELGFFDFDILRPSPSVRGNIGDVCRAIAFAIVEGAIKHDSRDFIIAEPPGRIRMVPVPEFTRTAHASDVIIRDDPGNDHVESRSVICDPPSGLLNKLFSRGRHPNRWLSEGLLDHTIFRFSTSATELMAQRAMGTYPLLREVMSEFERFEVVAAVKIGESTDHGESNDREHLWFRVIELKEDSIVAELANEPFDVASMHMGERYERGIDKLSDWGVATPVGMITPRSMTAARTLRLKPDEVLRSMSK